ncbi:GTP-binding protein [Synechocystis sp. PCC 7509]|uniref:GTP-binding protein n=1 Tax=Synechocystis sp. PCC 7509 TaxID=927677 RepID=UPI0002ACB78B|nr:GTP-binding protein [Synechocystis sp. PCC 7509]
MSIRQTSSVPTTADSHINRARASIRQAQSWYSNNLRKANSQFSNADLLKKLKPELTVLNSSLNKLDSNVIAIAAFGLVSRGKSAVLNALLGQKILQTGPLNGVTQWCRSVQWVANDKIQVELIDTPGLDEIDGEARSQMAEDVARQADLILFIVAGDITQTEYQALCNLRQYQKPLILVFNKIDLYPDTDKQAIYNNLRELGATSGEMLPDEIVMVSAEPAPIEVRIEWANGEIGNEWETPSPQIDELKQKILNILNREGKSLLALNALVQVQKAQANIASKTVTERQQQAEDLIWKYTKYKAIAIALNPIAVIDLLAGFVTDLALIRALARLYNLPMTGYEAAKLLRIIIFSSGGLLVGELGSSLFWGLGKSTAAISSGENPLNLSTYAGAAAIQAGIAAYGCYAVGRAAQTYLERGGTWGQFGASTVIGEILASTEPNTIIYRLRQELLSLK